MPLTIDKPALVLFLIPSKKDTEATLFIVFILSLVDDAASMVEYSDTMHHIILPLTFIDSPISKIVDTESIKLIV